MMQSMQNMMGGGMMWGMGIFGITLLAIIVLVIAALVKYLLFAEIGLRNRSGTRDPLRSRN